MLKMWLCESLQMLPRSKGIATVFGNAVLSGLLPAFSPVTLPLSSWGFSLVT